jgi:hypothetical protein
VRKIFAHANSDFQRAGEAEGGLTKPEFKQLLDKFNIPMREARKSQLAALLVGAPSCGRPFAMLGEFARSTAA